MVRGDDSLTGRKAVHTAADHLDRTDNLVAENTLGMGAAGDLVQIGAAQAAAVEPQENLAGLGPGCR